MMSRSGKIEELVDRQGRLSEVRRRSREVGETGQRAAEGPWISVSRQAGSLGSELAVRIAEALGWRAYDREILAAIAAETRRDEVVLSRLDEQGVREFDEYLAPLIVPDDPGQARFLVEMTRVIARLAKEGKAVLVGRGANWFLTPSCGLRVRVIGSLDARVAEVARAHALSLEEAGRRVAENDAAQRAFIHQAFHRDMDDPAGYDLVLNLPDLGFDAALESVINAAKAKLSLHP
jgi:cytidylate kinase